MSDVIDVIDQTDVIDVIDQTDVIQVIDTGPPGPPGPSGAAYVQSFSSLAQAQAAIIPSGVGSVILNGRVSAGDGGGPVMYTRAVSQPSHAAKFQSADGAWWGYASPSLNLIAMGAVADAVQDPTTGAWTGTDNTTAFQNWEAAAKTLGIPRYIPRGAYIVKRQITHNDASGFQFDSNVTVYGDGPQSIIVNQNTTDVALWRYTGVTDENTSVVTYLTAPAAWGDFHITVNDTSLLKVDEYILLIDHSQPLILPSNSSVICNVGQPARIRTIDDATHVTLYGLIEFPLTANAGAPITATTIRRYTAPATDIYFRDFNVVTDGTLAYPNTDQVISVRRTIRTGAANVNMTFPTLTSQIIPGVFADSFDYYVRGSIASFNGSNTYCWKFPGSFYGEVNNATMIGGRHLVDGTPTSVDGIEAAFLEVTSCTSRWTIFSPYQSHPGVRNWDFANCSADSGGSTLQAGNAGIQLRGRFCTAKNMDIRGYETGGYAAFGQTNEISYSAFTDCFDAIRTNRTNGFIADGNKVYNALNTAVTIDPSPNCKNIFIRNLTVIGNPATAVINNVAGRAAWDPSWRLENIVAPNATTIFIGVPPTYAWLGLGTVTTGTVSPDPFLAATQFYTNNGAHTLAPSTSFGAYILDIANGANAGAISTPGWNKVTGDSFATTNLNVYRCSASIGPSGSLLQVTNLTVHRTLLQNLAAMGLTTGLQLCIDAGDSACYSGTGTVATDTSGNSPMNFNLGAGNAFHGTAGGLSSNEYFTFDGTTGLTYGGANASWMNGLHKAGATWTVFAWVWVGSITAQQRIVGTDSYNNSKIGMSWGSYTNKDTIMSIHNATGTAALTVLDNLKATFTAGLWQFHAVTFDASGGTPVTTLYTNAIKSGFSTALVSPSSANASYPMQLGAAGNGVDPLSVGSRIGQMGMLNVAWTDANVAAIFNATRGEYGV